MLLRRRDKKNSLNKNCKAEVFRTQQEVRWVPSPDCCYIEVLVNLWNLCGIP